MVSFFGKNKNPGESKNPEETAGKTEELETVQVDDTSSAFERLDNFPIKFVTPDEEALFNSVAEHDSSTPLNISEQLLREPVESIKISVYGKLGRFGIISTIKFHDEDDSIGAEKKVRKELQKEAEATNTDTDERGGMLIYGTDGSNPLIVSINQKLYKKEEMIISTGPMSTGYNSHIDVLEMKESTPEQFKKSLSDIIGMTSLALCIAYENSKKTPAEQEIEIEAPKDDPLPAILKNLTQPQSKESNPVENIKEELSSEGRRVSFDDIGGQEHAKAELKRIVTGITNPDIYKKWGTKPPKGVLLYGPSGTGKTLLARALASEAEASFYSVSSSDVTSMWYGQSEKKIRQIFETAAKDEKAIIYFDEIDALTPSRASAQEATSRVIGVILQQMDGVGSADNITVVGSTNRRESIDQALLRPGRFDAHVAVEKPDFQARREIFSIHISKAEQVAERQLFKTDIDINKITEAAGGLTGADISEIVRSVLAKKVTLDLQRGPNGPEVELVSNEELQNEALIYAQSRE